jgi:hypothetical protein
VNSRRNCLTQAGALALGTMGMPPLAAGAKRTDTPAQETVSLCDQWWFRTDPLNAGEEQSQGNCAVVDSGRPLKMHNQEGPSGPAAPPAELLQSQRNVGKMEER